MMTRGQFLCSLGAGFVLGACSSSDGPDDDATDPPDATPTGDGAPSTCASPMITISANHGHVLAVPLDDILGGQERIYDISGRSPHLHSVVVTAAMFAQLEAGEAVMVTSSSDAGHSHRITITC
jgi:hypothetical protein